VVSRRHWAGKVFDGVSLEISTGPLNTIRNSFPQHTWTGNSLIEPDQHMWFAVGSFFQDLRTRVLAFYVSRITNLLYIRMSVSGSNPYFACRRDSCFCFWLCIGQWAVTPVFVLFLRLEFLLPSSSTVDLLILSSTVRFLLCYICCFQAQIDSGLIE